MTCAIVQRKVADTDGLASAYQFTGITSSGITTVENTGGVISVGVFPLPQWQIIEPLVPVFPIEPETNIDADDVQDALEAEIDFAIKGKDAFHLYKDYRARRLGPSA